MYINNIEEYIIKNERLRGNFTKVKSLYIYIYIYIYIYNIFKIYKIYNAFNICYTRSVSIPSYSGPYFPAFRLNTDQITPNTDTFLGSDL